MFGTRKRQKNERFENTLETAPFPIYEIDYKTPRFLRVNQATCKISGYTKQELLSMNPSDLLDAESAERFKDRIKRGLAGQKIDESVEFKLKAKDGHDVWVVLQVKPTYKDGKLDSALVAAYDITEQKKAGEALKASESKYHSLFTNLMDGFAYCQMIFDSENKPVDFVYLEINDAFERLTGLKRENIVGRKVSEAIPGTKEANPEIFEIYGRVAKTGNPERFELFFKPLSMWLDIGVYSPGEGYFVAVFENITERKKAQEAMMKAKEQTEFDRKRLETILEATPAAVVIIEAAGGRFSFVNKRAMQLYGFDTLGLDLKENVAKVKARRVDGTDYPIEEMPVSRSLRLGVEVHNEEMMIENAKGKTFPIVASTAPLRDVQGKVTAAIVVWEDITDRKKAEEALKESESMLQNIIDGSPSFIFLKDKDGRFITINKRLEESLGMKREELRGKTDYDIFSKEVADYYRKNDQQVLETKQPIQTEEIFDSPDGKRYTLLANKFPLFNSSGEVIATCGISIDITEKKKAEEALGKRKEELEQTQNRLEDKAAEVEEYATRMEELVEERTNHIKKQASLIDLSPDAIMVRRFDGTISFWSAGAEKLYGWTANEAIGRVSHDLLKTIFPISLAEINAQIRVTGSWSGELSHKTKDGRKVFVESRWLAEKTKAGKIVDILESNVDITERKKAEAAVLSERKRLFDVLETMPAMVCLITADYHIVFANRSFRERFGDSKGRPCYEYCWGQPEPCKFCESLIPLKTGQPHHWEVTGPDGSVIDVNDYPFTDVDGRKLVLEMDFDITGRRKAEAQAAESARKLHDAERLAAIGATAGMVGHDIRNPLQAITGDVYLAKSELDSLPDSEEKKAILESLEETEKNIDYINKIVADLQDYARPLNPRAQESDLKAVIEDIMTKQKLAKEYNVTLNIRQGARKIFADPDYLKRIIGNLILNAVQAMPNGGKLTVRASKDKVSGEVICEVRDTGVGIPDDFKDKLFIPMFTTKSKGQGFGLAVVKRMTETLGGTVTFESKVGKGTTFILRLPPPKQINGKLVFK